MLNKIIEFSVRNKLIIALFTIALIILGLYNVQKLPIDAVPDITNNQVQVITIAPSYGATDIERLVTFPIEQANNNIPGLKEIRSFSRFGLSLVTIVFDDNTDVYWARQQVAERLQQVQSQLPQGMGSPELGPVSTGLGEIYQYVVKAKKGYENQYDETELRTIQDWLIKRQLSGVKGVAEVSSFGGKLKQIEIAVQSNKLNALGLTINDVFEALEKNNQNTGGAYIEKEASVLFIRSEGLLKSQSDIENIAVTGSKNGASILLRDVAQIKIGYATRYGAMCYNNEGEVAGAIVMMLKGANSSEVIKNVKERISQIQKTLPEGVVIEPFLDRTKMVNNAIHTVEKNLLEGALIVVFVLVLFLGNFRAGFLVASVIPLSMLFAIILMNVFGVSGNLMSLGALDFGLIVDGAVIIVEAVIHQIHSHHKKQSEVHLTQENINHEVESSAKKMMNSAVFGQVIILIVYLPILTLEGIEGKMFKPMAQTVAFALLGAFILSLTYIPMMSSIVLKNIKHNPKSFSERMMTFFERIYKTRLEKVLQHKVKYLMATILVFILSIIVLGFLGGEFIPALEEGDFAVDTRVLTGSNINTTIASTQKAAHILKSQFPEVEKVVTKIGSGEVPTDPMPMEASDMMVILKDKSEWTSASSFNELAHKMSTALKAVPGITAGFQYPVQMRFNELMTGARQDVVCKIFGEDLDTLAKYADQVGRIIPEIQGTKDLYVEPIGGMPQVVINYNRNTIAQYGMNINDINKVVNTSFAGQSTGMLFEGEKRFDIVVKLDSEQKQHLEDIKNLLIPTPSGAQVPLYVLAEVKIINGPNQIQREDAKRRIVVGFNAEKDVQSLVGELTKKVEAEIKFPDGYYITYGGSFENLNEAKQRLMIAVPVSLLLIFLMLYFAFSSVKHALLIYSAIPLSTIGGILFLALRGMPFSISAGIGFIALFGVAVLNGIVLIAEFNAQKKSGITDLTTIIMNGTQKRLRPILMTALVASLGFLPMAISNGSGAEVQRPLATVVIGGLLVATFLTLFILPILYLLFEGNEKLNFKMNKKRVLPLLVLFFSVSIFSQETVTLDKALEIGIKNNVLLKAEKDRLAANKVLISSGNEIPLATLTVEYGQLNSAFNDNRFGISQNLSFLFVNPKKKALLEQQYQSAELYFKYSENELKREITQTYFDLSNAIKKERVLITTDSIYSEFLKKADLRLKLGETNLIEKSSAELSKAKILNDLNTIQEEKQLLLLKLQYLLQSNDPLLPAELLLKSSVSNDFNEDHIQIALLEQEKKINESAIKVEKAQLIPDISLGYFSTTMQGTGADDKLYGSGDRFNSVQLGLGLPIFNGANKARRQALKMNTDALNNQLEAQKQLLRNTYENFKLKNKNSETLLKKYQEQLLPEASKITTAANVQYINGEIGFLEWSVLMNQSFEAQLNYLSAVKNHNDTIIKMLYSK